MKTLLFIFFRSTAIPKTLIFLPFILVHKTHGQNDSTDYSQKKTFDALEERSEVEYRFVPMPSFDPTTKWGLAGIIMANYYSDKLDTLSPASMTGITGFGSTNGSWAAGIIQNYNFNQDLWRTTARLYYMSINQNLDFGPLGEADVTRLMFITNISARRQVINRLFLGLGYSFRAIEYEGRTAESQNRLDLAGYNQQVENHGLTYLLSYDTRDNIFYPYKGVYLEYSLGQNFDNASTAGEDNYLENEVDLRYFTAINTDTDHILALHAFGRFLSGNATNENYSFYGRSGALIQRGYEFGSFVDQNLFTTEIEYRRETPWLKRRLGFIGFVSTGKVFGDFSRFSDAEWLPAGGVGVRYRFLEYERMNFKTDVAYGKEGWTVYFGVREAF